MEYVWLHGYSVNSSPSFDAAYPLINTKQALEVRGPSRAPRAAVSIAVALFTRGALYTAARVSEALMAMSPEAVPKPPFGEVVGGGGGGQQSPPKLGGGGSGKGLSRQHH